MKKILLLLLLLSSYVQAQYTPVYFEEEIEIKDDLNNTGQGVIIAKNVYNPFTFVNYGRVKSTYNASSDFDAIMEADYIYDMEPRLPYLTLDTKIGEAIVKGRNGKYYIVDLYKY